MLPNEIGEVALLITTKKFSGQTFTLGTESYFGIWRREGVPGSYTRIGRKRIMSSQLKIQNSHQNNITNCNFLPSKFEQGLCTDVKKQNRKSDKISLFNSNLQSPLKTDLYSENETIIITHFTGSRRRIPITLLLLFPEMNRITT